MGSRGVARGGGRERMAHMRRQVQAMQGILGAVHPAGQMREVAVGVAEGPVGQHAYGASGRYSSRGVYSQQVPRRQPQHQSQGLATWITHLVRWSPCTGTRARVEGAPTIAATSTELKGHSEIWLKPGVSLFKVGTLSQT